MSKCNNEKEAEASHHHVYAKQSDLSDFYHCKKSCRFYGKVTGSWLPEHLLLLFMGAYRTFAEIIS